MTLRDWESTLADRERDRRANAYPQLVAKAQALLALLRATAPTADARTKAMGDMGALLRSLGEE